MVLQTFAFYLFALLAIFSALSVVLARNPVHAVLWLILAFLSSAGLFVLQGAEFVAMLMVIVYVGAVAVLFLFVVMMLDVDFATFRAGTTRYIPVGLLMGAVLMMIIGLAIGEWRTSDQVTELRQSVTPALGTSDNISALGQLIYTDYVFLFQAAGLILLVAMIGAIVLTYRRRVGVKRQNVITQMHRDPAASIVLKDLKTSEGGEE